MGLAIKAEALELLHKVSDRERAPFYVVGEANGDKKLTFQKMDSTKTC
jgi:phosphoribosylformylglycinamidine synthase